MPNFKNMVVCHKVVINTLKINHKQIMALIIHENNSVLVDIRTVSKEEQLLLPGGHKN